jgi:hypothetical protein
VTLVSRGNSASVEFQCLEVLSLRDSPCHCASRVLGGIIARTPMDAPTRTSIYSSWVTCHNLLSEETCLVNSKLLRTLSTRKSSNSGTRKDHFMCLRSPASSTRKSSTRKDHFMHLRSLAKRTFKCLILWRGITSTNLKNPKSQDDRKKGRLSNQPWLTHVTPTCTRPDGPPQVDTRC